MTVAGRLSGRGRAPAALAAAGSLLAFGAVLGLVLSRWAPLLELDRHAARVTPAFTGGHPIALWFARALTIAGTDEAHLVMLAPVVGWLLWRRLPWRALWAVAVVVVAAALNGAVKLLVRHARPPVADRLVHASGYGFPSGHADAAVVTYTVLLAIFLPVLGRGWQVAATAAAAVIVLTTGLSRVALGVHFVSDVLGGFALGSVWAALGVALRPPSPAPPERESGREAV